jgi:hypothetical protein
MRGPIDGFRTRILPALLTASGVTLLAAGLLSYTLPVEAISPTEPPPTVAPSVAPSATASPLITLPPLGSGPAPTATPSPDPDREATRVRIAALDIDMPVMPGPPGYPPCDVAMWLEADGLYQPGQGRATYIYAHARTGMFLPLLETPERRQLGMVVEVWTSDDWKFLYEIVDVRRNQTTLDDALAASSEELWLQTSEGPRGTVGKTQVIAEPLSVQRADPAEAHPEPEPVDCE